MWCHTAPLRTACPTWRMRSTSGASPCTPLVRYWATSARYRRCLSLLPRCRRGATVFMCSHITLPSRFNFHCYYSILLLPCCHSFIRVLSRSFLLYEHGCVVVSSHRAVDIQELFFVHHCVVVLLHAAKPTVSATAIAESKDATAFHYVYACQKEA